MLFVRNLINSLIGVGRSSAERSMPLIQSSQLSQHQHYRLEKVIPTAQLELALQYFIPCLALVYDLLNRIVLDTQNRRTLFDEKYQAILALFERMQQHTAFIQPPVSQRSLNNVIACFVFYRTLFQGVLDKAIEVGVVDKDVDPFIFHKRIPTQLLTALGAQVWRFYEGHTVVFGDLNDLVLNADITDTLMNLCDETVLATPIKEKKVHSEPQADIHAHVNPVTEIPKELPVKQIEINVPLEVNGEPPSHEAPLNQNNEQDVIDLHQASGSSSLDDTVVNNIAVQPSHVSMMHADKKINRFFKWLEKKIKSKPINTGGWFFKLNTPGHEHTLFITEDVLLAYSELQSLSEDALKSLLIKHEVLTDKKYRFTQSGHDALSLLALIVLITLTCDAPILGEIEEAL